MDAKRIITGRKPEEVLRESLIELMRKRKWFVKIIHGSIYTKGLPDLYASHQNHGQRWIECKNAAGYSWTGAQLEDFPKLAAAGAGIWVVALHPGFTDRQLEKEYEDVVLFGTPNWTKYWNHCVRPY